MSLDMSGLRSTATSLEELVQRLRQLAADGTETDLITGELNEIERQLEATSRRLAAALRRADRS